MKSKEILGKTIGNFTVVNYLGHEYFTVKCNLCNNTKRIRRDGIFINKSCGCRQGNYIHGLDNKSKIYFMWHDMKNRCYNPKSDRFNAYGNRGIIVCNEWKNDYKCFHDWVIKNGWKEGLQIDRKDNDGNYCPSNCRFVTNKQNSRNRQNTFYVDYNGQRLSLAHACELEGMNRNEYKYTHHLMKNNGLTFSEASLIIINVRYKYESKQLKLWHD